MRKVGEGGFGRLTQAQRVTKAFSNVVHKKDCFVSCKHCGYEDTVSAASIKKYCQNGYICRKCYLKGQEELKAAIKNLASKKTKKPQ